MISINAKSLLLAATLLGGSFVKADWASISEKGYGIGTCPNGGNILSPVFEDDAFDGMCEDLVADGCAKDTRILSSNAGVGWAQFTGAESASCEEKAPLGHLTCTNQFRNAYIVCSSSFSPKQLQSCAVEVFNGDDKVIGGIGFGGSCLPSGSPAGR